jgi:hypothetical protein
MTGLSARHAFRDPQPPFGTVQMASLGSTMPEITVFPV